MELPEKLDRLLRDLDTKFQDEGLYPEEEEARNEARLLATLAKIFHERYGIVLFTLPQKIIAIDPRSNQDVELRLANLESDSDTMPLLMRAIDTLRVLIERQITELKLQIASNDQRADDRPVWDVAISRGERLSSQRYDDRSTGGS